MRVSAGSMGPGWGCTCPSALKDGQLATAMGRASLVRFEYRRTEEDGTLVFRAWTRPEDVYDVTYHPEKPGKVCKHAIACAAHLAGGWWTSALEELRKEQDECQATTKRLRLMERTVTRLQRKLQARPSGTSSKAGG